MWKLTQTSWRMNKRAGKRQSDRDFRSFVWNHFCEFWEWPAFYCMIIRWWCENLYVERDDAYTLKNATWIHLLSSEKQVVNNSNFHAYDGAAAKTWASSLWKVSRRLKFQWDASCTHLYSYCATTIQCYKCVCQMCACVLVNASHNALDISKYNMSAKTIHFVVHVRVFVEIC